MKARAPGKLILSGEHAVVYGCSALALAVDRFAETTIESQAPDHISFNFLDCSFQCSLTIPELRKRKNQLMNKYRSFLDGKCNIADVISSPVELLQFNLINLVDYTNLQIDTGIAIQINSTIPIGCGMGSSAAIVLSMMHALAMHFNIKLSLQDYLALAHESEKLIHGNPSGIDVFVSLHGCCWHFNKSKTRNCDLPPLPMFIVNTGRPENTTGECVSEVGAKFSDSNIWDEFSKVTESLNNVMHIGNLNEIKKLIQENHRLLIKIGVVPKTVENFIYEIEQTGAAAKICGAGAISGEKGGIVLIIAENNEVILPVCSRYGYKLESVVIDSRGVCVV